ncbi:ABC transporter permease [Sporosarcina sp. NCCP-2716]|uniref:ABC transporter permease subunit n=1 Tax=Sporosarcina sp. NCCP-2716 TaxID=2943679 RepID=UPI002041E559|nr:ABC transporter permease subunit [Sporosarcina sp. NCCP-2716]GKV69192.1 ABC transporter permease [Sporosarcina sp. NCCP-2716]
MNPWIGFLKKEWTESVKSYKLLLVAVIFSILGVLNPFTAKITPALMENFMPEGTVVNIPEPTALDSWLQFYSNVPQMGLVVFILLFSTLMSKELDRGTLVILLTKGLRRSTVVTTKWVIGAAYWTLAFLLAFSITYAYTAWYWDQSILHHLAFAVSCVYLFGLLMFTLTLWGNTVFATGYGGLLAAVLAVIALFIAALFPGTDAWNPIGLLTSSPGLLTGDAPLSDFTGPLLVSIGAIAVLLGATVFHFNKKVL